MARGRRAKKVESVALRPQTVSLAADGFPPRRASGSAFEGPPPRSDARLLHESGLVGDEDVLDFFDVRHFRDGAALGDVAVALVFREALAEVGYFEMPVSNFPDLSLSQHGRPTIPS